MAETFGSVWRSVRLRIPLAPALLVQSWVHDTFRRAFEYRKPAWSWARAEDSIVVRQQKSGTVTVTNGSKQVQGVGFTFEVSDALRQFRTGVNQPVYSIASVNTLTNEAELDRAFAGTSSVEQLSTVLDAYVTMPEDFGKFIAVIDPANFWQLRHWITEAQLNVWDPQRSSTTTPWALVSRRESSLKPFVGRVQYELWPYATGDHEYWMFYVRRIPELTDETVLPGLFADRGDIFRAGALAEAARWPGTEERRNPYFNLDLAREHESQFTRYLAELEVSDEDIYPSWWEEVNWVDRSTFSPLDSRYLQSHDVL